MKLRSTTPTSRKLKTRIGVSLVAAVMAVTVPLAYSQRASADEFDVRIAALQRQIDQYQSAARSLGAKADTLQRTLDGINNEIRQIQAQIDLNQVKYDKLVVEIAKTEKEIAENRDALGEVIADLSIEGKITPLEMIASAKNISDFVDKQAYQSSIKDELNATIDRIKDLQAKLEAQKSQTETILENQKRSRKALDSKRAEQQRLVNETRGQESAYNTLRAKTKQEQLNVMEQQAAAIRAASANNGGVSFIGGSSGGYPWNTSNCYVDEYAMSHGGSNGNGGDGWGYGCRQCVSYVAWRIGQQTGVIPTHMGDAVDVPQSLSHKPQGYRAHAKSVGVITSGGRPGHVVWVETEPDAAGFIVVSQYNANYGDGWGNYSKVRVHESTYDTFVYYGRSD